MGTTAGFSSLSFGPFSGSRRFLSATVSLLGSVGGADGVLPVGSPEVPFRSSKWSSVTSFVSAIFIPFIMASVSDMAVVAWGRFPGELEWRPDCWEFVSDRRPLT